MFKLRRTKIFTVSAILGMSCLVPVSLVCPQMKICAGAEDISGQCGENLTWSLEEGVLTVSGTGDMYNYEKYAESPWNNYKDTIKSAVIKEGVTSISNKSFADCVNLISVTIPNSVTRIGYAAFESCENLTEVTIPDGITGIETDTFFGCKKLVSVIIPEGTVNIGKRAFDYCTSLEEITIPESVENIGAYAFGMTPWLEAKQAEDPLVIVNDILIDAQKAEGDVVVPAGVKCIASSSFSYNAELTSVKIPESTETINDYAFEFCENLTAVTLPVNLKTVGRGIFFTTPWLDAKRKESPLCIVNDILIDGYNMEGDLAVPEGVRVIAGNAFCSNTKITSVTFPDSLVTIGDSAFTECTGIESLTVPEGVESIGEYSFSACENLVSVKLPDSLASIGDYAFIQCPELKSVSLPANLEKVGHGAFSDCYALSAVTVKNPYCVIFNSQYTFNDTAAIYGYAGSTAEEYANKYGRTFVSISDLPSVKGDVNGDGIADLQDAAEVLNIYAIQAAGLPMDKFSEEQIQNADIDADGKITVSDAAGVLTYYSQSAAGMDPSWDNILNK